MSEKKKSSSTLTVYPEQRFNGLDFNTEIPWICKVKWPKTLLLKLLSLKYYL